MLWTIKSEVRKKGSNSTWVTSHVQGTQHQRSGHQQLTIFIRYARHTTQLENLCGHSLRKGCSAELTAYSSMHIQLQQCVSFRNNSFSRSDIVLLSEIVSTSETSLFASIITPFEEINAHIHITICTLDSMWIMEPTAGFCRINICCRYSVTRWVCVVFGPAFFLFAAYWTNQCQNDSWDSWTNGNIHVTQDWNWAAMIVFLPVYDLCFLCKLVEHRLTVTYLLASYPDETYHEVKNLKGTLLSCWDLENRVKRRMYWQVLVLYSLRLDTRH